MTESARIIGSVALSWEERSGLVAFLSKVQAEVEHFEAALGYGVRSIAAPPSEIDGETVTVKDVGFVVVRDNTLTSGRTYCLFSILRGKRLLGFIGTCSQGRIRTLRELRPMEDFQQGTAVLYEWLRDLVKASCEKL
ncbi:MAG: hypothetical protein ACM3ON_03175 [Chloroflexota bacterium]